MLSSVTYRHFGDISSRAESGSEHGDAGGGERSRPAATRRRREDRATAPIAASVPVAWVLSPAVRSHDHQRLSGLLFLRGNSGRRGGSEGRRLNRARSHAPLMSARTAPLGRSSVSSSRCRSSTSPIGTCRPRRTTRGPFLDPMTDQPLGVRTTRIVEPGRSRCAIGRTVPGWTHRGDDCWLSTMTGRTSAGGRGARGVAFRWWSRRHKRSE